MKYLDRLSLHFSPFSDLKFAGKKYSIVVSLSLCNSSVCRISLFKKLFSFRQLSHQLTLDITIGNSIFGMECRLGDLLMAIINCFTHENTIQQSVLSVSVERLWVKPFLPNAKERVCEQRTREKDTAKCEKSAWHVAISHNSRAKLWAFESNLYRRANQINTKFGFNIVRWHLIQYHYSLFAFCCAMNTRILGCFIHTITSKIGLPMKESPSFELEYNNISISVSSSFDWFPNQTVQKIALNQFSAAQCTKSLLIRIWKRKETENGSASSIPIFGQRMKVTRLFVDFSFGGKWNQYEIIGYNWKLK